MPVVTWRTGAVAALVAALGVAATTGTSPTADAAPGAAKAPETLVSPGGVPWTWGANSFGQLGDGSTTARPTPGPVTGLSDVVDLHGGREHVIALRGDRTVWVWGSNGEGQLGLGTTANRPTPTQVPGLQQRAGRGDRAQLLAGADGRRHGPDLGPQRGRPAR